MIQIGVRFKLLEQSHGYLSLGAPASFARRGYKEITLRGVDVRLETGGRIYELSTSYAPSKRWVALARSRLRIMVGSS
jgi:hypothetical protein